MNTSRQEKKDDYYSMNFDCQLNNEKSEKMTRQDLTSEQIHLEKAITNHKISERTRQKNKNFIFIKKSCILI